MPTERFFNLPQRKRERILEAARQEVARVPYEEVSINQIIKRADIPRGSFYQYFEDKDDLLEWLLQTYQDGIVKCLGESLERHKGDVFPVFNDVFLFALDFGTRPDNFEMCRNLFAHQKFHASSAAEILEKVKQDTTIWRYWPRVSLENLRRTSEQDLKDTLEMLIILFQSAILEVFQDINKREEVQKSFKNKLRILRDGALKETGKEAYV